MIGLQFDRSGVTVVSSPSCSVVVFGIVSYLLLLLTTFSPVVGVSAFTTTTIATSPLPPSVRPAFVSRSSSSSPLGQFPLQTVQPQPTRFAHYRQQRQRQARPTLLYSSSDDNDDKSDASFVSVLGRPVKMVWDALQPLYYKVEKGVASKSIPNVSGIPNRLVLKDHWPIPLTDDTTNTFDHSLWTACLQRHTRARPETIGTIDDVTVVDYKGMGQDPDYQNYLNQLSTATVENLAKAEQLAFWMNAYNALCMSLIIEHEKTNDPLTSITKIKNPDGGPVWDKVAGTVAGKQVTLNQIEHSFLRGTWDDPRIHACIVCASASCPNLRREAFTTTPSSSVSNLQLPDQMDDQLKQWLKHPTKGLKVEGANKICLSRIFLWFQDDFAGASSPKHVVKWLAPYYYDHDTTISSNMANGKFTTVRYFEYDWAINRASS